MFSPRRMDFVKAVPSEGAVRICSSVCRFAAPDVRLGFSIYIFRDRDILSWLRLSPLSYIEWSCLPGQCLFADFGTIVERKIFNEMRFRREIPSPSNLCREIDLIDEQCHSNGHGRPWCGSAGNGCPDKSGGRDRVIQL